VRGGNARKNQSQTRTALSFSPIVSGCRANFVAHALQNHRLSTPEGEVS
jgi:hypothetical protein